ncbi:MAG TPA: nitrous oxide reductase accessory protein NosL [Ohtaekwangia sp.]|nr:nitrous oxide reductase accessory protein NosL [Ohtaekwangia sp.]
MKHYASPLLIAFITFMSACTPEPEPLVYGEDACQHCKMVLMDQKFGAEIVTTKGKVYKFDDVNCMISFINENIKDDRDIQYKLVTQFNKPGELTDAGTAFYVKASSIKSPMASQVAAFGDYEEMKQHSRELKGIYLTWGELVTQFK